MSGAIEQEGGRLKVEFWMVDSYIFNPKVAGATSAIAQKRNSLDCLLALGLKISKTASAAKSLGVACRLACSDWCLVMDFRTFQHVRRAAIL